MNKILRAMLANKATTAAGGLGFAALMSEIGLALNAHYDGDPNTVINWNVLVPLMMVTVGAMFQGFFSRDAWKSSQESGVRDG